MRASAAALGNDLGLHPPVVPIETDRDLGEAKAARYRAELRQGGAGGLHVGEDARAGAAAVFDHRAVKFFLSAPAGAALEIEGTVGPVGDGLEHGQAVDAGALEFGHVHSFGGAGCCFHQQPGLAGPEGAVAKGVARKTILPAAGGPGKGVIHQVKS